MKKKFQSSSQPKSPLEALASGFSFSMLGKATELKSRLFFVMIALIVARIGTYIPLPGIDPQIVTKILSQHKGGVLDLFDVFSGGAVGRQAIFALAIIPYISASIIMQLAGMIFPSIGQLRKDGDAGRRKLGQYVRFLTIFLAAFQAFGVALQLEKLNIDSQMAVADPGLWFRFTTVVTLVGGTMFLVWLGEQITSRGIGNGTSLIIFSGIVANLSSAVIGLFELGRTTSIGGGTIFFILVLSVFLVAMIVFFERAQRKILIHYPRKASAGPMNTGAGDKIHMPHKLNISGVIPPIFASSILLFPMTIVSFSNSSVFSGKSASAEVESSWMQWISIYLGHGKPLYVILYIAAIIFFSFFYASVVFNSEETAGNLKKNGGFVAGIRPGKQTAEYFDKVILRITAIGSLYLAFVCALPEVLIAELSIPFYLGGTSLLIAVNVILDFITQVQSHLLALQYDGLIKKARLRGKI